jgi:elongation factor Ts
MAITAQDVNKLRQLTGAGMMDCKKALTEAGGDMDAAIDYLRKKGQKVSAARSDREASEGAVFVKTNEGASAGVVVSLNCETDFVAKNEDFRSLGESIAEVANTSGVNSKEELLEQELSGGQKIHDVLTDYIGKIGEKIEIGRFEKVTGERVVSYIHGANRIGVLVALKGTNGADVTEVGKDVAMQIAAMRPIAVDKEGVDESTVAREIEIGKEQARAEGKPEEMLEKIATGKLNKFYKDNTLLNQEFVKDPSLTIAKLLDKTQKGLTVTDFKRVAIG